MEWFVTFSFFQVYYRLVYFMFQFVVIEHLTDAFDGKLLEIILSVNPFQNTIQKKNGIKDKRICNSSFNNFCTKTRVDLKKLFSSEFLCQPRKINEFSVLVEKADFESTLVQ